MLIVVNGKLLVVAFGIFVLGLSRRKCGCAIEYRLIIELVTFRILFLAYYGNVIATADALHLPVAC